MIGLSLCFIAFGATLWAGRRSLGLGLVALLFWGYFFGIVRANLMSAGSYFIFDAGVLGFYLSQKKLLLGDRRSSALRMWCWILMLWPVLLMAIPFQPFLVSLVGLRGSILFLPMMLAGSRLRGNDLRLLAFGFAALNLVALGFAGAEYVMGLQRFYPHNAATMIIYSSSDVEGGFFRIPAIFANAHLYGGTMAGSLPYLIAAWEYSKTRITRWLILAGIAAALLGVLLSATRLNFVVCSGMILVMVLNGRMAVRKRAMIAVVIVIMAGVAMRNTRFQRFKSLSDTSYVEDRISGSVNRSFFELLIEYPLGNGLGGGGTSIPYFLSGQVRNPIGLENEYSRILCEQGIIGLTMWLGFVIWFLMRFKSVLAKGPWASCRRLVFCISVFTLGIGAIGMGMLTAVPQTPILLLGIGFVATPMTEETGEKRRVLAWPLVFPQRGYQPVPSLRSET